MSFFLAPIRAGGRKNLPGPGRTTGGRTTGVGKGARDAGDLPRSAEMSRATGY